MSADPAMEEYIPLSPEHKNAQEYNQNLPGLGGIYNSRNLQVYHYAGNNPIMYVDPSGRSFEDIGDAIGRGLITAFNTIVGGAFHLLGKAVFSIAEIFMKKRETTMDEISSAYDNGGVGFARLAAETKIVDSPLERGFSAPTGNIWASTEDDDYDWNNLATTAEGVDLFNHELFHQYQYRTIPGAFGFLVAEFLINWYADKVEGIENFTYSFGKLGKKGTLMEYFGIREWMSIHDILTLEGQAEAFGQYANYNSGKDSTVNADYGDILNKIMGNTKLRI